MVQPSVGGARSSSTLSGVSAWKRNAMLCLLGALSSTASADQALPQELSSAASATVATTAHASPVLLTIVGASGNAEAAEVYHLTEEQVMALPATRMQTSVKGSYGSQVFYGPLLHEALASLNLQGDTVRLIAFDGTYLADVPRQDLTDYNVLLAHTMNGMRLSRRLFGPLWAVYPKDQYARSYEDEMQFHIRSVWHLETVIIYQQQPNSVL